MKKFNFILALMFAAQSAFAGVITDDKLELGKPSSSASKQLIFKGPTKKTLSSSAAGTLGYDGNGVTLGDGANTADKTITFNKGANSPSIKYNFTTGTIQFSNDNVNFVDIGSGSGGAGGIQMLADAEFEKTPLSTFWTPSAGTLTALTTGADFSGFDKQSASWVPTAAATLSSETITIVNGLLGARGSASIFYKTASALHKLQVFDGTTVLAEKVLPVSTGFRKEEMTFAIPLSGTVQFRVLAGDTTAIFLDKAFMGVPSAQPADEDFAVVKNLFPNPKAEGASPSFLAYKDAAGVSPVDGIGGSPTLTCTLSSSLPLEGTRSFVITKPASNVQGEGCAHNLKALEDVDKAKVLQVSFDYKVASGTYLDDTLKLYVYDIDNAQMIELAPTTVKNSTLSESFRAVFQTTLTGVNYRLIWHYAGTGTVAASLKVDNVRVSSQLLASGSFATDWVNISSMSTAGFIGLGAVSIAEARYKFVGDSIHYSLRIATGTHTATTVQIPLPPGLVLDNTKCSTQRPVGKVFVQLGAITSAPLLCNGAGLLVLGGGAQAAGQLSSIVGTAMTSTNVIGIEALIPIVGKTSNTVLASEYSQRGAAVWLVGSSIANTTVFDFPAATVDILGEWNAATDTYTCKVPGVRRVSGQIQFTVTSSAGQYYNVSVKKNGTDYAVHTKRSTGGATATDSFPMAPVLVPCNAGETIQIGSQTTNYSSVTPSADASWFIIEMLGSTNTQIAASESLSVRYSSTAGTSIPNSTSTVIAFGNLEYTSHPGAYNTSTGVFTAPISGKFLVCGRATIQISNGFSLDIIGIVFKNGAAYSNVSKLNLSAAGIGGAQNLAGSGCDTVPLLTGETAGFGLYQSNGAARNLSGNAFENNISITRVGN